MDPKTRPEGCNEENCEMISCSNLDHDPKKPFSAWCFGVRKGVIAGKENAIKNVPSDIFITCTLLGSHSEDCGQYRFINNIADFYLQIWLEMRALHDVGLLRRTMRSFVTIGSGPMIDVIEDEIKRYREHMKNRKPMGVGTKFIEFSCSCNEIFFREYNHRQTPQKYYIPDETDEKLFDYHRRLGHTIFYKKAKHVKHSRVGNNPFWQIWGPREWKPQKV